ncbi:MAG: hypothetical protein H6Q14_2350 [Bacteroidetes bacterium]|nr:hypothetical protein [Bacteroidota bacterium]
MQAQLRLEDYPAIADFIFTSFERDLADFTAKYKTMNSDYLAAAKSANITLKSIQATLIAKLEQKDVTAELYTTADSLKSKIILLKDYAQRGKIPTDSLSDCVYKLTKRNIEGALLTLRSALPYYDQNSSKLLDMPDGFLVALSNQINELDTLNNAQNTAINRSKESTANNKEVYKQVYQYITDIAKAGKIIYAKTPKADEYTISKLQSRVRAAQKKDEKGETTK